MKRNIPSFAAARPKLLALPFAQAALPILLAVSCSAVYAQSSVNISGAIDAGVGYVKSPTGHEVFILRAHGVIHFSRLRAARQALP